MTAPIAPALKALLNQFIDYAGLFPPAGLSLDQTIANYHSYQNSEYSWMLRWLVVPAKDMENLPAFLNGRVALLGDTDHVRAATVESKALISAAHPLYCEVSDLAQLKSIKDSGSFAKLRTGGIKSAAIPSVEEVAEFISGCASQRLPFKATAGLHHPIRADYALTYDDGAPRAVMHGFLNVLMASAFAWHGEKNILSILSETDPTAFTFDDHASWKGRMLSLDQIEDARQNFMHSVGSCSFDEPVHDLQSLGLFK